MRKTLFALLGLVAIGIGAVPALAGTGLQDPPKVYRQIKLENTTDGMAQFAKGATYKASLSGTLIKNQQAATSSWFLYPGACAERATGLVYPAAGAWHERSAIQADSLNTYAVGSSVFMPGGYSREDLSLNPRIIGIVDAATPVAERPTIPTGSRALWCGKYDPNWVVKVGYPNLTNQIMYIDLESNRTPIAAGTNYTISMKLNMSLEQNYDYMYFVGGGDGPDVGTAGDEDPLHNDRAAFDAVKATGSFGAATLQATFTGSITALNPVSPTVTGAGRPIIIGEGGSQPATRDITFIMTTDNRAWYVLIVADCLFSNEDGLWPFGHGVIFDDILCKDALAPAGRSIFAENALAGGTDAYGGDILVSDTVTADETDGVRIAARVFPGRGAFWAIQAGNDYPTGGDVCASKSLAGDHFFFGVDPVTKVAKDPQFNSINTCTFAVPSGTADIFAVWDEFINLPRTSGWFQDAEYRIHKNGAWGNWQDTQAASGVNGGTIDTWFRTGNHLAAAVQADSFQVRYEIRCIAFYGANQKNCDPATSYAVLYDNLFLQIVTGTPTPLTVASAGGLPQSTFVDGTMTGVNCAAAPCWPGIRGSDLQTSLNIDVARSAVKDNLNSVLGDSLNMNVVTGLRKNGMGVNWHFGYDKGFQGGLTIKHTNGAFNPAFDTPRMIYRLYDPLVNNGNWSPWDSTSLDGNNVSVSADTVVIDSEYRIGWPPRDKIGLNLPGGYSINGVSAYNGLAFLPRGTRLQYYFKGVDINGGVSYSFDATGLTNEVEDLPPLPNTTFIAPAILEFDVLPRKYPVGVGTSLVTGKTDTPVLDLDNNYGGWDYFQDPVTAALRGMGVRADRYRFLGLGDEGHNIGGHELLGDRQNRLSNYFPNYQEYSIVDSLRNWYRIIIQSTHDGTEPGFHEQDAQVISDWAKTPGNAPNGSDGDRCLFLSGDDAFNALTNVPGTLIGARELALSRDVYGVSNVTTLDVSAAKGQWAGSLSNSYATIDDRFASPGSGPGLAAAGLFTYEVDGGCEGPNRFDPLTALSPGFAAATYPVAGAPPVTDVAAVAISQDFDAPADFDQIKALGYGYSIQFVRGAPNTIPRTAANYVRSGAENRMQILYKFLTGCRGARGSGSPCWPCPTDATMLSNWALSSGFGTGTYGPLLPIQDFSKATGIGEDEASAAPRPNNLLLGNSPNPFNPLTKISFSAAQAGKVTIRIFNVAGQLVRTLETKVEKAGPASVYWDGKSDRNVSGPSGVYFYKATFANGVTLRADKNMVLVK